MKDIFYLGPDYAQGFCFYFILLFCVFVIANYSQGFFAIVFSQQLLWQAAAACFLFGRRYYLKGFPHVWTTTTVIVINLEDGDKGSEYTPSIPNSPASVLTHYRVPFPSSTLTPPDHPPRHPTQASTQAGGSALLPQSHL